MNLFYLLAAFSVIPTVVESTACATCKSTYDTDLQAATGNPAKCTVVKTYIDCLETDLATCTAANLKTYGAEADSQISTLDTDCTVDAASTCGCERNAMTTDVTAGDTAICTNAQTAINCLRGSTDAGCKSTRAQVAAVYEERFTSKCTTKTSTCTCEIAYAKADVGTAEKKCTAAKALASCLQGTSDAGCKETRVQVGTFVESTVTCAKTEVCTCEIAFAKADTLDGTKHCTAIKAKLSCIGTKTTDGCDGTKSMELGVATRKVLAGIAGCSTTDTCKCETDYAKADLTTKEKQCTEAKKSKTCLEGISSTTEKGCDGSSTAKQLAASFAQPLVTAYCGAASLSGIGMAIGMIVMMFEIIRRM